MSPNTKTDGPAGDFVFGDAIIPSGVPGGQAIRAASIRTLVDYSKKKSSLYESSFYEAEQAELKKRAAALQAELDKSQAATVNAEKFMGIVRKHLAFEELTPTLLREMIEKIVVHECSYDENGTRRQDIEIYYSFVGKIDLPE
jgi:hypothetical protein